MRDSLLVRIGLMLLLLVSVLGAALFIAIDHFVSRELHRSHAARLAQQTEDLRRFLEREIGQFRSLAELVASDSDLLHSAQYHVLLRGENKALVTDVARVARVFQLDRVSVLDATASRALVDTGTTELPLPSSAGSGQTTSGSAAAWIDGALWMVAWAALRAGGETFAWVEVGRVLQPLLGGMRLAGADVRVHPGQAGAGQRDGALRFPIKTLGRPQGVEVEVSLHDAGAEAVARTKRVLVVILSGTCLLLLLSVTLYLRRALRPIHELTELASAVGRGEFGQRILSGGAGEVARLVTAFTEMVRDLKRLQQIEQKLRHQEKLSAIGKLATQVAHDINNPLTVIYNASKLALKSLEPGDPGREDLELIVHHCGRCIRIVENLLRFGRPLKLRVEDIELGAFCARALERCQVRLPQVPFRLVGEAGPLHFSADPYQLEQMLDNLLNNAAEASNGKPIEIAYGATDAGLFLRVTDHGAGFSAESLDRLFEPFFTTKSGGTGLGLANSAAIARAHGGDIRVTAPEKGEITVFLPGSKQALPA